MKLVRCVYRGVVRHGIVEGDGVRLCHGKTFSAQSITDTVILCRSVHRVCR